ncbi:MAG: hypothetical protein WBM88_00705, partial [Woeseiaceae bacterium]
GHVSLLSSLEEYLDHPEIIVIRGEADEIARWQHAAASLYAPRRLVFGMLRCDRFARGAGGPRGNRR